MSKTVKSGERILFVCNNCGGEQLRWSGKCPTCGEWNSFVETRVSTQKQKSKSKSQKDRGEIGIISLASPNLQLNAYGLRLKTGYTEFDRTLGGGFVPGQVALLSGDPGIGKSTLLLQIADSVAGEKNPKYQVPNPKQIPNPKYETVEASNLEFSALTKLSQTAGAGVLYIAGEESPLQIKQRAQRLGIGGEGIEIIASTDVDEIISHLSDLGNLRSLKLLIIDSIQTLTSADVSSGAGSVAQVKVCAMRLTNLAKQLNVPLIMIGHVNKEGDIAGPKVLEHIVDTVLYLEGERTLPFRILRAIKNRFGDPMETGVWQMGERGFKEVVNPGLTFIDERRSNPGSVVTVALEGNRPLLLEIQSLTAKTSFGYPRRSITGYDPNRLLFIVAVLEKHLKLPLQSVDIYVNVTGGVRISEPAADLAVALAVVGSFRNLSLKDKTVVFGELGLTAEIRSVPLSENRVKEAKKLGFTTIVGPGTAGTLKEAVVKALA